MWWGNHASDDECFYLCFEGNIGPIFQRGFPPPIKEIKVSWNWSKRRDSAAALAFNSISLILLTTVLSLYMYWKVVSLALQRVLWQRLKNAFPIIPFFPNQLSFLVYFLMKKQNPFSCKNTQTYKAIIVFIYQIMHSIGLPPTITKIGWNKDEMLPSKILGSFCTLSLSQFQYSAYYKCCHICLQNISRFWPLVITPTATIPAEAITISCLNYYKNLPSDLFVFL